MVQTALAPICTQMHQRTDFGANLQGSCNCIIFSSATEVKKLTLTATTAGYFKPDIY